ncbi:hypothetical protein CBR_g3553 [Chara braunii]|nr:hypothetical protein CBR_g3553 [Chara braunii]|eukprot:GBG68860.1 hypothetical protein CBR_g3553 [Chara braunii]
MTVSFTSILAVFVIERIDERTGTRCLIPFLAFGIGTIAYWRWTDDLRFYLVVQFFPLIAIPWMTLILPPKYSHNDYWLWAAAWYVLAKIEEVLDKRIFKLLHFTLSGHTLKHLCAAMTPVCILLMLHRRCVLTERLWDINGVDEISTATEVTIIRAPRRQLFQQERRIEKRVAGEGGGKEGLREGISVYAMSRGQHHRGEGRHQLLEQPILHPIDNCSGLHMRALWGVPVNGTQCVEDVRSVMGRAFKARTQTEGLRM